MLNQMFKNMKQNLTILTLAMLLGVASAFAQGGTTGPLTWNIDNGTLTISGEGAMPDYEWDNNNRAPWCAYVMSFNNAVIENGVTNIGNMAFQYCTFLNSITIPSSVTDIGIQSFYGCYGLNSITIPNGITHIKDGTFASCQSLTSITLPGGITSIGESAFAWCFALKSITIPSSVTTIGNEAFTCCHGLTSITVPSSVLTIGDHAFLYCLTLVSLNVESGNPNYASEDGVLFNKDKTNIITCPVGKTGDYVIPNSVTTIGEWAFLSSTLSSITFSDGVQSIGDWAFQWSALTSITLPNSVTSIGVGAFSDCQTLTSITLPNDLTSISECAFQYCSSLVSITIPNKVKTIENAAFNRSGLISIILPNGLTTIGNNVFYECYALTSITVPDSLTTIGSQAFNRCLALTSIIILNNVTTIGYSAFSFCTSIPSITILSDVVNIGDGAFYNCHQLASVTILSEVATIGTMAFLGCSKLTSITIPSGATTIGDQAFSSCDKLTSITLPSGVTAIESKAFSYCKRLTSITNLNPVPIDIDADVFCEVGIDFCTLKVPIDAVSAYKDAAVWKDFNIVGGDYLVKVSADNAEYGYATGYELYQANDTATVKAIAYNNYQFVSWTKDGIEISTDNPYRFIVTEDMELVANFEESVGIVAPPSPSKGEDVRIYPNPTTGLLTICDMRCATFDNPTSDNRTSHIGQSQIEIFDIMGCTVGATLTVAPDGTHQSQITMDISHLPAGIYFVRIQTENGTVTRKVVKE